MRYGWNIDRASWERASNILQKLEWKKAFLFRTTGRVSGSTLQRLMHQQVKQEQKRQGNGETNERKVE